MKPTWKVQITSVLVHSHRILSQQFELLNDTHHLNPSRRFGPHLSLEGASLNLGWLHGAMWSLCEVNTFL